MTRDVLRELSAGIIGDQEAESVLESILHSPEVAGAPEAMGLDHYEWTAYGHGVGLAELSRWRYLGWPRSCVRCGGEIRIEAFGWFAEERAPGEHVLTHLQCSNSSHP